VATSYETFIVQSFKYHHHYVVHTINFIQHFMTHVLRVTIITHAFSQIFAAFRMNECKQSYVICQQIAIMLIWHLSVTCVSLYVWMGRKTIVCALV